VTPEIRALMKTTRDNRYDHRDVTIMLVAYWHSYAAIDKYPKRNGTWCERASKGTAKFSFERRRIGGSSLLGKS
jgi:hypothetical protein